MPQNNGDLFPIRAATSAGYTVNVDSRALANHYKWITVTGVDETELLRYCEILARAHYTMTSVYSARTSPAKARKEALVLAAVRLATQVLWRITDQNLDSSAISKVNITCREAYDDIGSMPRWTYQVALDLPDEANMLASRAWYDWTRITGEEELAVHDIASHVDELVPIMGWSIVNSGRRCIFETSGALVELWRSLREQVFGQLNGETATWLADTHGWRSHTVFYTACRPIAAADCINLAYDYITIPTLDDLGYSAAMADALVNTSAMRCVRTILDVMSICSQLAAEYRSGTSLGALRMNLKDAAVALDAAVLVCNTVRFSQLALVMGPPLARVSGGLASMLRSYDGPSMALSDRVQELMGRFPQDTQGGRDSIATRGGEGVAAAT